MDFVTLDILEDNPHSPEPPRLEKCLRNIGEIFVSRLLEEQTLKGLEREVV
jgi:hypothetical protein